MYEQDWIEGKKQIYYPFIFTPGYESAQEAAQYLSEVRGFLFTIKIIKASSSIKANFLIPVNKTLQNQYFFNKFNNID